MASKVSTLNNRQLPSVVCLPDVVREFLSKKGFPAPREFGLSKATHVFTEAKDSPTGGAIARPKFDITRDLVPYGYLLFSDAIIDKLAVSRERFEESVLGLITQLNPPTGTNLVWQPVDSPKNSFEADPKYALKLRNSIDREQPVSAYLIFCAAEKMFTVILYTQKTILASSTNKISPLPAIEIVDNAVETEEAIPA